MHKSSTEIIEGKIIGLTKDYQARHEQLELHSPQKSEEFGARTAGNIQAFVKSNEAHGKTGDPLADIIEMLENEEKALGQLTLEAYVELPQQIIALCRGLEDINPGNPLAKQTLETYEKIYDSYKAQLTEAVTDAIWGRKLS